MKVYWKVREEKPEKTYPHVAEQLCKEDVVVDVFVNLECINLYFLYCTPMFLSRESLI